MLGGDDRTPAEPQSIALPPDASREIEPNPNALQDPRPPDDLDPAALPIQVRDPKRYANLGEHGRGGLGRVSRSRDRELGRDVAIKEMLSRENLSEARFLREVLITARLEHPGIVPMYEAGRWPDGTPFYAMKLVSGRSLRDLLAERTTVDQRIGLLHNVIAVADAIAYAHSRNIIHRDLKPANVIVGEFGETIVIDWGLAKELSTVGEPATPDGPGQSPRDSDLTEAGAVVGTPTYMAPEQERGEHVDQRADVFAIGAMLWELCSLQKVPPTDLRQRDRMLRRAGIDQDLIAIIDKALAHSPERRYSDAGALASDLKAFKSGARISARNYSLFATLAHWTRRHRTLALSATIAVLLAAAGSLVYVRNIAIERDRADRTLDAFTLKHAELLLTTDPSAALDALASYQGPDRIRADQIRAEAVGRGVALVRALPHTDVVRWTAGAPDGSIISLGSDGTIAQTYLDGRSRVLTRGVSKISMLVYAPARHLLAYTCDPIDLCLFDIVHAVRTPLATVLQGSEVNSAAFSPNGAVLAVLSRDGTLRLIEVTDPARPIIRSVKQVTGGKDVTFVDDGILAVSSGRGIKFVRVTGDSEDFALQDNIAQWAKSNEGQLAVTLRNGLTIIVEPFPVRITAKADLCGGTTKNLQFIPGRQSIAYACRQGSVGIWDLRRGTTSPRVQLEGNAHFVVAGSTGDYIVAAGGNGIITIVDLSTDMVASYKGHGARLTSLTPPTGDYPFLISGDARGGVRAWLPPLRLARVVATSSGIFNTAVFDKDSTTVVATTWGPALTVFSGSTGARTIAPHEPLNNLLERSSSGKTFATYGLQELVEVWSLDVMTRSRIITTAHGSVTKLRFIHNTEEFITSGNDGRLVRWTPNGDRVLIAKATQAIDNFAHIATTGAIAFSTVDGAFWRVDAAGRVHSLRPPHSRVNRILATHGGRQMYIGYESGDVIALDTTSWKQETILRGFGAIREIAAAEDAHTVAVLTSAGTIHVGSRRHDGRISASSTWTTLLTSGRDIALTTDGVLLVACPDGTLWLYSTAGQRWLCLPLRTSDLGKVSMAPDGKAAVALDREGRVVWIDVEAARKLLAATRPTQN